MVILRTSFSPFESRRANSHRKLFETSSRMKRHGASICENGDTASQFPSNGETTCKGQTLETGSFEAQYRCR
jgi:hypothetical protein